MINNLMVHAKPFLYIRIKTATGLPAISDLDTKDSGDATYFCHDINQIRNTMDITYKTGITPSVQQVIDLYDNAGLNRPTSDPERIGRIYACSNLIVTAWDGELLVGVARSLTDFHWNCYLADLAVRKEYQASGVGKRLVAFTRETAGDQCMLLLLAVPTAMEYYPKIGMENVSNGFIISRTR